VASIRLALLSALVAIAALVAACGDDEETTTQAPAETTTETESVPAPVETAEDEDRAEVEGDGVEAAAPAPDPESTLEAYFVSGDPDLVCGELATARLVRTAYGDEEGCRQAQVPAAVPKSIEVDSLEVSATEAVAVVIPAGGPNDGIETTVTLVDDGGWRVDTLEADVPAGP
jgi:hypothetical protein